MGNCKDCKYWEPHNKRNKKWHTCGAASWVDYDEKIEDGGVGIYADASDDSGLVCGLRTGPMFGCVKFSAKRSRND